MSLAQVLRLSAAAVADKPSADSSDVWIPRHGTTPQRIRLRPGTSDVRTAWMNLTETNYRPPAWGAGVENRIYREIVARGAVPLIVDLGANIGTATLFFVEQFPEARIEAVEPDRANFELLRHNTVGDPWDIPVSGLRPAE